MRNAVLSFTQILIFAHKIPVALLLTFSAFWASCFAGTTDLANWYIENLLVVIFLGVLCFTYRSFRFSNSSYLLMFVFLCLHTYGAKYAYADNPLGFKIQEVFALARNPYDRIVHCSFGLLLACPMRDLLLNRFHVKSRTALLRPIEITLSLSALFELIEWAIADVVFPEHGKNYVGTQGDIWDAQKDMALATFGALLAMAAFSLLKNTSRGKGVVAP